jgi:L-iditol 2-dehydrogenase
MRAVEVRSDGSVAVVERPVPVLEPGDALMRPLASGICGSDLLGWYAARKAGTILGHEVAGEIVEVGREVRGFRPGDLVVPHHHAPCLSCDSCRAGRHVHCAAWRSSALDPGGMAELVRIPANNLERDTRKVPEGLSAEEASWTEPLATVVKAFARSQWKAGFSILVVGLGSAGQLAVRLARARSAARIAGTDRVAFRLARARESGADVFEADARPLEEVAREVSKGRGFDVVFVGPGKGEVIRAATSAVAPGGVLLLFTMAPPEESLTLSPFDMYFREVSVVPSYSCGPDDTREALDLLGRRVVAVADLVTHRFPIARAEEAFARARDPEGSVKVMLTFGTPDSGRGTRGE